MTAESDGSALIRYIRSSFSGGSGCVEVGADPTSGEIALRHSRKPEDPPHMFTHAEWQAFLSGVRDGQFEIDKLTG